MARLPPAPQRLPYFRAPSELPGPLPRFREITDELAKSNLSYRHKSYSGLEGGVCIIRGIFVVKVGVSVTENEGNALLFLETQKLDVPIPRLFAMYRKAPDGELYLIMEHLPGADLRSIWDTLGDDDKSSIALQLSTIVSKLRSLQSPDNFIGGVCGGPLNDPLFVTYDPDPAVNGPFTRTDQIGLALATQSRRNWENGPHHSWLTGYFFRHLPVVLRDQEVKFTHADFHARNILVVKVPSETSIESQAGSIRHSYRVSGILDWETAGWYPTFWEYASVMGRFHWDDGWLEIVDTIMKPYPLEGSMFLLVMKDLGFA